MESMKVTEANGAAPRALAVRQGLVLPPGVLRALLPDVASVVTNALASGPRRQIFGLRKLRVPISVDHNQPMKPKDTVSKPPTTISSKETRPTRNILNPFPCNICKQRFPSRRDLNIHWLQPDTEYCNTRFCHPLAHNRAGRAGFECSVCGECFEENLALTTHMWTHSGPVRSYQRAKNKCKLITVTQSEGSEAMNEEESEDPETKIEVNETEMWTHSGPMMSYQRVKKERKPTETVKQSERSGTMNEKESKVGAGKRKIEVNETEKRLAVVIKKEHDQLTSGPITCKQEFVDPQTCAAARTLASCACAVKPEPGLPTVQVYVADSKPCSMLNIKAEDPLDFKQD